MAQPNQQNLAIANARPSDFLPQKKFGGRPGEDAYSHILEYEYYCRAQNLNAQAQLARFGGTLTGQALIWLDGQNFHGYNELREAFLTYFSGIHSREGAVEQWKTTIYTPGESIDQYLVRLRRLAQRLNYNNELIKDQFLAGLPANIRVNAAINGGNLNEVAQRAQRYIEMTSGSQANVTSGITFQMTDLQMALERINVLEEKFGYRGRTERRAQTPGRSGENRSSSRDRDRRNRERSRSRDRRPYKEQDRRDRSKSFDRRRERSKSRDRRSCFWCFEEGHQILQCDGFKAYMKKRNSKLLAAMNKDEDF